MNGADLHRELSELDRSWHFDARRGRWLSIRWIPDLDRPWNQRRRAIQAALVTAEDVDLYAAELGLSREEIHR